MTNYILKFFKTTLVVLIIFFTSNVQAQASSSGIDVSWRWVEQVPGQQKNSNGRYVQFKATVTSPSSREGNLVLYTNLPVYDSYRNYPNPSYSNIPNSYSSRRGQFYMYPVAYLHPQMEFYGSSRDGYNTDVEPKFMYRHHYATTPIFVPFSAWQSLNTISFIIHDEARRIHDLGPESYVHYSEPRFVNISSKETNYFSDFVGNKMYSRVTWYPYFLDGVKVPPGVLENDSPILKYPNYQAGFNNNSHSSYVAIAQDPEGDELIYRWTRPSNGDQSIWNASPPSGAHSKLMRGDYTTSFRPGWEYDSPLVQNINSSDNFYLNPFTGSSEFIKKGADFGYRANAIEIDEYRHGQLISQIVYDIPYDIVDVDSSSQLPEIEVVNLDGANSITSFTHSQRDPWYFDRIQPGTNLSDVTPEIDNDGEVLKYSVAITQSETVSFDIKYSDPDGDPVQLEWYSLDSGFLDTEQVTFDPTSSSGKASFSWTPSANYFSNYSLVKSNSNGCVNCSEGWEYGSNTSNLDLLQKKSLFIFEAIDNGSPLSITKQRKLIPVEVIVWKETLPEIELTSSSNARTTKETYANVTLNIKNVVTASSSITKGINESDLEVTNATIQNWNKISDFEYTFELHPGGNPQTQPEETRVKVKAEAFIYNYGPYSDLTTPESNEIIWTSNQIVPVITVTTDKTGIGFNESMNVTLISNTEVDFDRVNPSYLKTQLFRFNKPYTEVGSFLFENDGEFSNVIVATDRKSVTFDYTPPPNLYLSDAFFEVPDRYFSTNVGIQNPSVSNKVTYIIDTESPTVTGELNITLNASNETAQKNGRIEIAFNEPIAFRGKALSTITNSDKAFIKGQINQASNNLLVTDLIVKDEKSFDVIYQHIDNGEVNFSFTTTNVLYDLYNNPSDGNISFDYLYNNTQAEFTNIDYKLILWDGTEKIDVESINNKRSSYNVLSGDLNNPSYTTYYPILVKVNFDVGPFESNSADDLTSQTSLDNSVYANANTPPNFSSETTSQGLPIWVASGNFDKVIETIDTNSKNASNPNVNQRNNDPNNQPLDPSLDNSNWSLSESLDSKFWYPSDSDILLDNGILLYNGMKDISGKKYQSYSYYRLTSFLGLRDSSTSTFNDEHSDFTIPSTIEGVLYIDDPSATKVCLGHDYDPSHYHILDDADVVVPGAVNPLTDGATYTSPEGYTLTATHYRNPDLVVYNNTPYPSDIYLSYDPDATVISRTFSWGDTLDLNYLNSPNELDDANVSLEVVLAGTEVGKQVTLSVGSTDQVALVESRDSGGSQEYFAKFILSDAIKSAIESEACQEDGLTYFLTVEDTNPFDDEKVAYNTGVINMPCGFSMIWSQPSETVLEEGGADVTLTLRITGTPLNSKTWNISGSDYWTANSSLVQVSGSNAFIDITANQLYDEAIEFTISNPENDIIEGDREIKLQLDEPSFGEIGSLNNPTITLKDNDTPDLTITGPSTLNLNTVSDDFILNLSAFPNNNDTNKQYLFVDFSAINTDNSEDATGQFELVPDGTSEKPNGNLLAFVYSPGEWPNTDGTESKLTIKPSSVGNYKLTFTINQQEFTNDYSTVDSVIKGKTVSYDVTVDVASGSGGDTGGGGSDNPSISLSSCTNIDQDELSNPISLTFVSTQAFTTDHVLMVRVMQGPTIVNEFQYTNISIFSGNDKVATVSDISGQIESLPRSEYGEQYGIVAMQGSIDDNGDFNSIVGTGVPVALFSGSSWGQDCMGSGSGGSGGGGDSGGSPPPASLSLTPDSTISKNSLTSDGNSVQLNFTSSQSIIDGDIIEIEILDVNNNMIGDSPINLNYTVSTSDQNTVEPI